MFIIANLFHAIAYVLDILLTVYVWIIIISALISWVNPDPYNPIVRFLYGITDPVLRPIRNRIGVTMGIDVSPMIVILIILFIRYFLIQSLFDIAIRMR
ncbi:MAG: YggT family protein [Thermodesulfovibrionia bacterium]